MIGLTGARRHSHSKAGSLGRLGRSNYKPTEDELNESIVHEGIEDATPEDLARAIINYKPPQLQADD